MPGKQHAKGVLGKKLTQPHAGTRTSQKHAIRPSDLMAPFEVNSMLTHHQRLFVEAYMGPAGGVAIDAIKLAGICMAGSYDTLRQTANKYLNNPRIQEALAVEAAKVRQSPEWAKASLIDIASSNMANFIDIDEDGTQKVNLAKAASMGALGQIKELRQTASVNKDGTETIVNTVIKLHDRTPALTALLKLYGFLQQRMEHSGTVTLRPMTLDGDKDINAPAKQIDVVVLDSGTVGSGAAKAAHAVPKAGRGD